MGFLTGINRAVPIAAVVVAAGLPIGLSGQEAPAAEPVVEIQEVDPFSVYLFMDRYCVECHGGHLKKPKGQFGFILDLRRLIHEAYVIPGAPEDSDIYISLTSDDPDFKMPPDDSDGPKPTAEEIARIHDWILAGAIVDPEAEEEPDALLAEADPGEEVQPRPTVGRIVGRLHPLVVHFPVALLICAAGATLFARMRGRQDWLHGMVRGCLWVGAAGALVAATTGWIYAGHEGFASSEANTHRWLGVATALVSVAAVLACEFLSRINAVRWQGGRTLQVALLVAAAVLVAAAGHTGGLLTYGRDFFWGF